MDTQETKVYIAILIGAAVLAIILIYFIVNFIRQQRRNYALYLSKIQAEVNTLEKERKRVARDLHDDIAPVLMSVKYNMNSFDLHDSQDLDTLQKTNGVIDGMISRMREI